MDELERLFTADRDNFDRHIGVLEAKYERLDRKFRKALKRSEQEKAKKYDKRLDEAKKELDEFKDYVEWVREVIGYITKPLDERPISEQIQVLKLLAEIIESMKENQ